MGCDDPGSPSEYLKGEDASARDRPPGTTGSDIPQYAEVPPNLEAAGVISCFSAVPPDHLISCY